VRGSRGGRRTWSSGRWPALARRSATYERTRSRTLLRCVIARRSAASAVPRRGERRDACWARSCDVLLPIGAKRGVVLGGRRPLDVCVPRSDHVAVPYPSPDPRRISTFWSLPAPRAARSRSPPCPPFTSAGADACRRARRSRRAGIERERGVPARSRGAAPRAGDRHVDGNSCRQSHTAPRVARNPSMYWVAIHVRRGPAEPAPLNARRSSPLASHSRHAHAPPPIATSAAQP
jgi:hypothetical protein